MELDFNNALDLIERLDLQNDQIRQLEKNREGNCLSHICFNFFRSEQV